MALSSSLANHLLIAMPTLQDPNFDHAVIYICEHNAQGAVGLIINRPMQFPLKLVFDQLQIEPLTQEKNQNPLLFGGPVQTERGFVIHRPYGTWRSSLVLGEDVTVTTSSDIIHAIAKDTGPKDAIIALGYSGWEESQLDEELYKDAWLVCPYRAEILYEVPYEERWFYAGQSIGVNMNQIYLGTGHA